MLRCRRGQTRDPAVATDPRKRVAGRYGPRTLHAGPGLPIDNYTWGADRLERVCPTDATWMHRSNVSQVGRVGIPDGPPDRRTLPNSGGIRPSTPDRADPGQIDRPAGRTAPGKSAPGSLSRGNFDPKLAPVDPLFGSSHPRSVPADPDFGSIYRRFCRKSAPDSRLFGRFLGEMAPCGTWWQVFGGSFCQNRACIARRPGFGRPFRRSYLTAQGPPTASSSSLRRPDWQKHSNLPLCAAESRNIHSFFRHLVFLAGLYQF